MSLANLTARLSEVEAEIEALGNTSHGDRKEALYRELERLQKLIQTSAEPIEVETRGLT